MNKAIENLRLLLKEHGLGAYLIPSSDPHQDEYVPGLWKRRQFISGFSGSAGDALITLTMCGLWTDSRYFIQAEKELDSRIFTLFRAGQPDVPSIREWLRNNLTSGDRVGVDPRLLSDKQFRSLEKNLAGKGIILTPVDQNLVDEVWPERPVPPVAPAFFHDLQFSGESVKSKLQKVRKKMKEEGTDLLILAKLDSIAWLFNIRGFDIPYNPVVIAYAAVTHREAILFVDTGKLDSLTAGKIDAEVFFHPYDSFSEEIKALSRKHRRIWLDEDTISHWVVKLLDKSAELYFKSSPVHLLKAVKNPVEIQGFRKAHIRDGAAVVKFLAWLEKAVRERKITEISAAEKLAGLRAKNEHYRGLSFPTISAFGPNGAVVHYAPSTKTNRRLEPDGLYLIDSGGQYLNGTTDITRTVCLGKPLEEHKEMFTLVLKGVIGLTITPFPHGTSGKQLDTIARLALWRKGLNYGHGTGHGVGSFLNVHEGPQSLSPTRCPGVPLEPGMVTTIEPGYYKKNHFGIRTENVVLVVKDETRSSEETPFYAFETFTLCPIDLKLVKKDRLTKDERNWLNDYHKKVFKILAPHLEPQEKEWLKRATRKLPHL
ncbi:MAG: aminopeptidase P family protein [Candidatus Aminicenantes bacterium]|nr:aminopeptidase P family protein [Candidatus Aminicenantes bacterium]